MLHHWWQENLLSLNNSILTVVCLVEYYKRYIIKNTNKQCTSLCVRITILKHLSSYKQQTERSNYLPMPCWAVSFWFSPWLATFQFNSVGLCRKYIYDIKTRRNFRLEGWQNISPFRVWSPWHSQYVLVKTTTACSWQLNSVQDINFKHTWQPVYSEFRHPGQSILAIFSDVVDTTGHIVYVGHLGYDPSFFTFSWISISACLHQRKSFNFRVCHRRWWKHTAKTKQRRFARLMGSYCW